MKGNSAMKVRKRRRQKTLQEDIQGIRWFKWAIKQLKKFELKCRVKEIN